MGIFIQLYNRKLHQTLEEKKACSHSMLLVLACIKFRPSTYCGHQFSEIEFGQEQQLAKEQ